ncbi:LHFPL tetraspan subfamily member 2a protein isoform X1 [Phlebotomus papatasi]|uniref:LHFPL tetraspan subfamily member 2a protein isoform X1 n=1 Tax=Phlebotomus papatasi TaxID=29031 RepID=UPI0024844664|nr:LHFPL tetraspan subfamily member 2a protein isoform X1 [Phlebotomus papatasi]
MCYVIITGRSLLWFLMSLVAGMLTISATVSPKWLIGPEVFMIKNNFTTQERRPSLGIYTRCTMMLDGHYHCGPFDFDGFFTDPSVYPPEFKACMFFISLGLSILSITVFLTLITCCRQSLLGKSIHTMTGSAQAVAGISIMVALFLHPLGWGAKRVLRLCGDSEAFYPGDCTIGWALYCAVAGMSLAFLCALISLKAESANMSASVRRRVEAESLFVLLTPKTRDLSPL